MYVFVYFSMLKATSDGHDTKRVAPSQSWLISILTHADLFM